MSTKSSWWYQGAIRSRKSKTEKMQWPKLKMTNGQTKWC